MRCKNCGSENDDNLYICQNCGSPLFDEENEIPDEEKTQIFAAQGKTSQKKPVASDTDDKKKKQTTIIIVVLCIVLAAVIAGTVIAIVSAKNKNNEVSSLTQVSTSQTTSSVGKTEKETTQTTTETTTQTTTETTTETTKETTFSVSLSCNDGGEVEGEGTYKRGENVTILARADDNYTFEGWYEGSVKLSSKESYTFTVTKDVSIQAIFVINNSPAEIDPIGSDED